MKTGVKVEEAMTNNPKSISPSSTIKQCAEEMKTQDIGSLLIIENNKLVGIITETDLIHKVIIENLNTNSQINTIMSTTLITTSPETDIYDALKLMQETQMTRLPVIKNETPVGMLTIKDIIRIQPQIIDWLTEKHRLIESTNKAFIAKDYVEGECENCDTMDELKFYKGKWLCSNCRY